MGNFRESISKGISKINIKTVNFMEKNKAKTYIKSLEQQNNDLYYKLGKLLYEKYLEKDINFEVFQEDIEKISQNLLYISEQEEKISKLDEEEKRILGSSDEEEQIENIKICKECDCENQLDYKFCTKCGNKFE